MVFRIISANFERTDGLVEFKIQVNEMNVDSDEQERHQYDNIDKNKLWKEKIRIPKYQIQYLKNVLKMSQSYSNIKSFYGLYGPKMISMDFGLLELFNVKSTNEYQLDLEQFDQSNQFIRWGRVIQLNDVEENYAQQQCELNYYLLLLKERLYSIRTCLFYKNDNKRKQFPYSYLFVFEMQDTIQFCLNNLKRCEDEQTQSIGQQIGQQISNISQRSQISQISQNDDSFSKLIEKKMIHYQRYSQQDIRNLMNIVLIPFQIFQYDSEIEYIQILAEVQIKNDNNSQSYHGTFTLIQFCDRNLSNNEINLIKEFIEESLKIKIQFSNNIDLPKQYQNNKDNDQTRLFAEYIDQKYLNQNKLQWSKQIFEELPQYLLNNPPNVILPIQYLFPEDEKSVNYYRQQFK